MPLKPKASNKPKVASISPQRFSVTGPDKEHLTWSNFPPPLIDVEKGYAAWRTIWCGGFDLDEQGKTHYHHLECIPCHCPPGPQMLLQLCGAREIAAIGTRGSAKSEGTFGFLTAGNLSLNYWTLEPEYDTSKAHPADITYLNCPDYSFLVLRKNSKDLVSYFRRASRYFELWGGVMTKEPMGVTFPSGAYGIFDHLADEDAYEKYIGGEFTRIILEEANQIPEEKRYLKLKASCRTSNPRMRPQLVLTYNPGGPGAPWLKSRFIMPGGKRLPFGKVYADPYSGQTRVVIFSSVEDNPYSMAKGYHRELDSLRAEDPALYRQWRLGDFDVQANQFFQAFREKPTADEPANACHILSPKTNRDPSWPIAIGCDWGYSHPAAVLWGAWTPKKQLHVYREFVTSQMGERELGVEIARRSLDDLAKSPNPHFNLYLSHDAFHRENEGPTEASRIAEGIDSVLGKGAAFIFDRTEEESLLDDRASWEAVKQRAERRQKSTYITVINAGLRRRGNMNLIRDYLRWWPLASDQMKFDEAIYRNLMEIEGEHSAREYFQKCQPKPPETLPILQVYFDPDALDPRDRGCERLVATIPMGIEKEGNREELEKVDGDDTVDCLAYLVGNFKHQLGFVSDEEQVRRKIAAIREKTPNLDMNAVVRAAERIEAAHARSKQTRGITIPRISGPMRHRMRQGTPR